MNKSEKVSFDTIGRDGRDVSRALKVITRVLGRGNQADGIRRALIETAERINRRETVKMSVPEDAPAAEQPSIEAGAQS